MISFKTISKGLSVALLVVVIASTGLSLGFNLAPDAQAAACGIDDAVFDAFTDEVKADIEQKAAQGNCDQVEPPSDEELEDLLNQAQEGTFENRIANLDPPEELPKEVESNIIKDAAEATVKIHRIFAPLINFASFQIGNFLDNDYIYQGQMGKMLQRIWVISRNLVNIAAVFLLLWIALKTIFSPEGLGELKKSLLKFVLLLVAVNFSWLASKVILDAASVATHVVFAIPTGISDPAGDSPTVDPCKTNPDPNKPISGLCYPTKIFNAADAGSSKIVYFLDEEGNDDDCAKAEEAYDNLYDAEGNEKPGADDKYKNLLGRTSMCVENLNIFKYDQNTATIYMTYGMARIQNLIDSSAGGGSASQLAVSVIMSLVLQIVYAIALLALFVALIFRMIALWLLVAFSPFLVLLIGFGEGSGDASGLKKYFSFDQFISWAFAPAKVGVIFTVAFLMISAGQSIGNVTVTLFNSAQDKSALIVEFLKQEALFAGIGSLQNLIWFIMVVVVLWIGTFSVLGNLTIIGGFFDRIKQGGQTFATALAKLPYVAPILPQGRSIQQAVRTVNVPYNVIESVQGFEQDNVTDLINFKRSNPNFKADIEPRLNKSVFNREDAIYIADRFDTSLEKLKNFNESDIKRKFKDAGATEKQADELYKKLSEHWGPATAKSASKRADAAPTVTPPDQKPTPTLPSANLPALEQATKQAQDAANMAAQNAEAAAKRHDEAVGRGDAADVIQRFKEERDRADQIAKTAKEEAQRKAEELKKAKESEGKDKKNNNGGSSDEG